MTVVIATAQATQEFLNHAYNAMYSGQIVNFDPELRRMMLTVIIDDAVTAARTLPKSEQDEILNHIKHRFAGGN